MNNKEERTRFSLEEVLKEADKPTNMITHVLKNPEGDYSIMGHIVCEWCDYCTEQKSGIKVHDFKEDPYEIEEETIKYSVPIHEDGVPTKWTVDFEEGDEKYHQFMATYSEIPMFINVITKKNG